MRKFLAIVSLIITLSMVVSTAQYNNFQISNDFLTDIDMTWYEEHMEDFYNMGILKGDGQRANGDKNITRGEFIALLTRTFYDVDSSVATKSFADMNEADIFYKNAAIAKEKGLVKGDNYGNFNPNSNITREQAALITSRLLNDKTVEINKTFKDIPKNYIYKIEIERAAALGVINGYPDNTFKPKVGATRAESVVMILNALEQHGVPDTKSNVEEFAKNYFENDVSNISANQEKSTGTEYNDIMYRKNIINYISDKNVKVLKTPMNVEIESTNFSNNRAKVVLTYDMNYVVNYPDQTEKIRDYGGEKSIYMLRKNNEWKVYYSEERLILKDKINLTWEVMWGVPDYAPKGVNIISPTWYELVADNSFPNAPVVYSDSDITIKLTDKSNKKYLDYVKNNGFDLWIAYRNDFNYNNTRKFMQSTDSRLKAVKQVVEGVISTKAEGINFDFENMLDRDVYTKHVKEVALAIREMGLVTSVDVTKYEKGGGTWSMCFDRDKLSKIADYIVIMSYDQNGTWSTKAGPVAGYTWFKNVVDSILMEVPNDRLILGLPFYVRVWQERNGRVIKTSAVSMETANNLIRENNASIVYSQTDRQNVATWTKGDITYKVWIEDSVSLTEKANLINEYSLSGVASWRRGFETNDVWNALYDVLNS